MNDRIAAREKVCELARRLLTLAATRASHDSEGWAWLEVERVAVRILAELEPPLLVDGVGNGRSGSLPAQGDPPPDFPLSESGRRRRP